MPAGVPTDQRLVDEFRALYIVGGSVPGAAKEVGLAMRTAYDIAERLEADPSFARDRRKIQTCALERLVSMRMRVAEGSLERFEGDDVDVQEHGENVTVIDKRPDYGRLVLEAERSAHHLAKVTANADDGVTHKGPVTLIVCQTAEAAEREAAKISEAADEDEADTE